MNEEDVMNLHCGDCLYYHNCKRIDHISVKFAVPWFKSYDRNQSSGIICNSFEPATWNLPAQKEWKGFDSYWSRYVETWLPYKNTNGLVYFTLGDNADVRYGVPLMDYLEGKMIENGILKAKMKMYYRRTKEGYGYKLIREQIDGISIDGNEAKSYNE